MTVPDAFPLMAIPGKPLALMVTPLPLMVVLCVMAGRVPVSVMLATFTLMVCGPALWSALAIHQPNEPLLVPVLTMPPSVLLTVNVVAYARPVNMYRAAARVRMRPFIL